VSVFVCLCEKEDEGEGKRGGKKTTFSILFLPSHFSFSFSCNSSFLYRSLNPLHFVLLSQLHTHTHTHMHTVEGKVVEYLVQRGDLGVPVSVMDRAVVSAVLALAEVCCPPLGSVRAVLLSPHILLAIAASLFFPS